MSSTMTVMPAKNNQRGIFGGSKPVPVWLQFVPGIVLDVVVNDESPAYQSERDINSILAKSHVTPKDGVKLKGASKKRYYPLFRGMTDVPIKGDQVLLCTFGGVDYYMGPINTMNSPNWNIDHLNAMKASEMGIIAKAVAGARGMSKYGLSRLFPVSGDVKRMQKKFKRPLDDSLKKFEKIEKLVETHGDMVFEGRHGNSLRIGSRDMNPYLLISNGRALGNEAESNLDGTIFLISDDGTIHQHFPGDIIFEDEKEEPVLKLFTLASDTIGEDKEKGQKRLIGAKDPEDGDTKGLYDYTYKEPQAFLNSDRITINAKKDSIFLSSYQDLAMGSGNNINIISENSTVLEASNIYIGKQAKQKKKDGGIPEPMVLGEQLRLFLEELVGILETAHGLCQGAPIPVMDSSGAPLIPKWQKLKQKISDVTTAPFTSEYHFIEDNGNKPE